MLRSLLLGILEQYVNEGIVEFITAQAEITSIF